MEDLKHEVITKGIDRLSALTGEDFHGYRSEIYSVLSSVFEDSAVICKSAHQPAAKADVKACDNCGKELKTYCSNCFNSGAKNSTA